MNKIAVYQDTTDTKYTTDARKELVVTKGEG